MGIKRNISIFLESESVVSSHPMSCFREQAFHLSLFQETLSSLHTGLISSSKASICWEVFLSTL